MADNREILNEAEVEFLLTGDEDTPNPQAAAAPATPESQTVTMRGDLEQINLADIFQTLSMSKMEGVLRLRNPIEERQIHCRDGVVQILVPNRLATRRLGQRLIQAGLVEAEQLRTALVTQRKHKKPLGELLIDCGFVTKEQIESIVGMQVAEDLFNLFTWRHGTFEFFKGALSTDAQRAAFANCPEFEVNSLLLEVARRSDEWQSILDTLGSLDEVPERIADPADESALDEDHRTLLAGANGQSTYRELAEQSTSGLFEMSRAARDLVNGGLLANVGDGALVTIATQLAESDRGKQALVLLQTLRDRPGERAIGILQGMSRALEKAGERRLAGAMLLEAAQRQTDPDSAIELARAARELSPYDPGSLSYLRTILIAHGSADSPELEKCTIDLLDALIDGDLIPTALDIVADARATGTLRPQVLVREARARQKMRDAQGAAAVLLELAELYDSMHERQKALEAYEALLRIDRSRKDIAKLIALRKQTRLGRIVRLVSIAAAVIMLGGMGLVFWQQQRFNKSVEEATNEIAELLARGERHTARERWESWLDALGDCEPIEDLRSRIAFAESAEQGRLQKLFRAGINERLTQAADALGNGELTQALTIYRGLWSEAQVRDEVIGVVNTRLSALLDRLEPVTKGLLGRLPPAPDSLLDRRDLLTNLADLENVCPPVTIRWYQELSRLLSGEGLPAFVDVSQRQRIERLVQPDNTASIARAAALAAAYSEALQRNEHQRRLDPMFKAAVQRETIHDFAGALELYRQLEAQPASDAGLRAHFRDRVARNATIVRLLEALDAATKVGDFATAQQQFRALKMSFAEIPFERMVRLPLHVQSQPPGGRVTCNGKELGTAPMILTRLPAETLQLQVALDGFRSTSNEISGDEVGSWLAHLSLPPDHAFQYDSLVERTPVVDGDGILYLVDRSGKVTAFDPTRRAARWIFRSSDLSGLLTQPLLDQDVIVFGSLDGELRALRRSDGKLAWSLPDLATECGPVLVDRFLALATTDAKLRVFHLGDRRQTTIDLPERAHGSLLAHGSTLVALGERGRIRAFALPALTRLWQQDLPDFVNPNGAIGHGTLVVVDEHGLLRGLDLATGEVRWRRDLATEVLSEPVLVEQDVLVATPERILRCDVTTGQSRPEIQAGSSPWQGQPLLLGKRLIAPVADGGLQVLDASDGSPLYRLECARRSRAILAGQTLLVVGPDHRILVYPQLR
jgi:outer membrane protein assembly factor BamB/tetratricopeptide (TPR) repeat protein